MKLNFDPSLIPLGIIISCGIVGIVYMIRKFVERKKRIDALPVITIYAKVITKRQQVYSTIDNGPAIIKINTTNRASSTGFITFESENGIRKEFYVNDNVYGLLAKGDVGKLTFKGDIFLSFQRMY